MKKFCLLLLTVVLTTLTIRSSAQVQQERIKSSYILAFAKDATDGEVNYWLSQGNLSLSQLLDRHRQYITNNRNAQLDVIVKSYLDVFGRLPTGTILHDGEIGYWLKYPRTYAEMRNANVQFLNTNPGTYVEVIKQAFKDGLRVTNPSSGDISAYTGMQNKYPYDILRTMMNQRSNNKINLAGTVWIYTRVSPGVATEARNALGMGASGGGNMVAAGAGNMVAAGAGNLIGNDGSTMVAAGGGNFK